MSIIDRIATAYHPQTNGLDEKFNSTLQEAIAKQVDCEQRDWDELIDGILFVYRTTVHESTKQTPFSIMYGRESRLPVEIEETTSMSDEGMERTVVRGRQSCTHARNQNSDSPRHS